MILGQKIHRYLNYKSTVDKKCWVSKGFLNNFLGKKRIELYGKTNVIFVGIQHLTLLCYHLYM